MMNALLHCSKSNDHHKQGLVKQYSEEEYHTDFESAKELIYRICNGIN